MADRVHPRDDSPQSSAEFKPSPHSSPDHQHSPVKPAAPLLEKPIPPPPAAGTYVIQIPKDQVYRVPPPENAKRYQQLSRRKPRRSTCRCCLCWSLGLLVTLILLAGIAAGVLYLVFRPEAPKYSIDKVSIKGFNLTSSEPLSPEFDVTVRAENPNDKLGFYYRTGSSIDVHYQDNRLCNGQLPVFYQGTNNVTVFKTVLKSDGVELTSAVHKALVEGEKKKAVPFKLNLRAPVKIKVGSVKTWTITVKVDCDVAVDELTTSAKIVSKDCDYGVELW
ncbi:NDR1/HIN1-like protein 13 [Ricinus communis]|uniref:NDR1/HIN1-like protein 13 n=1 Tax=Ricinus communis TaxID=3988 RepID=UPI00201A5E9C|nr:NDR1/HIN1-like protein 13 [Ricinus communis]